MLLSYTPLSPLDPFADATKGDDRLPAGTEDYIHIRIQQRNGRKTLTTVQGIADDYDKKKLVKAFKKVRPLGGAWCLNALCSRSFGWWFMVLFYRPLSAFTRCSFRVAGPCLSSGPG